MNRERLDPTNPIPLYHQLKEVIRECIASGVWSSGDAISSEHQLQAEHSVSRNTVQKALTELVQEGVLTRRQGKGTFVAAPKLEQALTGFYSFSNAMTSRGSVPSVRVISLKETQATSIVARHLEVDKSQLLTALTRVRYADGEPIMLETSYIPTLVAPDLAKKRFEESALYTVLANDYNIIVVRAKEIFEPVLIREWESKWLDVRPGFPALLLDRIAYSTSEQPIEFCRSIVRGDRCRFYTELL